jgi:23S rRNA (cytidine1920-2'-O)/16S rRNA (cytidine1409-2'-O)-methyltransferase
VVVHEGVNLRTMPPAEIGEAVDLATLDLAFISLRLVEPAVRAVVRPGGEVAALVKPQFEAGRADVGKGGIVRDPDVRARAVERVAAAWEAAGWRVAGGCPSPVPGADGNLEHFVRFVRA